MSEQGRDGFAVWTVLRRDALSAANAQPAAESLAEAIEAVQVDDVTVRGLYDVSVLRADADLMLWLHGPDPAALQAAVRRLRRSRELAGLALTWSAMGVHRDAEFNKSHVPGFMRGERARGWLCVYPFVRSYDWYVLPDDERRAMLAEHGRKGAAFTSVIANTVSSFALNDYEWLLPMESDELTDLVDMMRDLRATKARLHVREEVPFFTGRLIGADQVAEVLA